MVTHTVLCMVKLIALFQNEYNEYNKVNTIHTINRKIMNKIK